MAGAIRFTIAKIVNAPGRPGRFGLRYLVFDFCGERGREVFVFFAIRTVGESALSNDGSAS